MQDRNGRESLSHCTFCKVFDPDRPPPDSNMNNNNNNGDETDHGDRIDQGGEGEEGLDEDIESDNSPDSIIDNNKDGTGLGTGTSIGLGIGTDSSTSDDNSTSNDGAIDTDEVSTDESQHGDQNEQHVLEGATRGVPMATTTETNVLADGDLGTPGLSSITTGASQSASGRITGTTRSMHVQDGVHRSSFDRNNPHTDRLPAGKIMSDLQILELLPQSQPTDGNATPLMKCNADGCSATGIPDCQGYCTKHFCNLYRQGNLDIALRFEDEIQRGMLNLLLHEGRSARPRTRAFAEPPNPHHEVMGSAQGQDHGLHEGRSSSQGHDEGHRRTSKVKCMSSMCNFAARETGYCSKCSRTNQLCAKPKEKYRCLATRCSNKSNSKRGLCRNCISILERLNAKEIQLPKPEIQRLICFNSSSSSDEDSKGNEKRRNRRDRHTRRNEHYEPPPIEGSYLHNKDIGVGARRRSPPLYSNENQHTRQNSAREHDQGRGSRCCEPQYESGACSYHNNDYEMRRYDHTNGGRHTEYDQHNSARQRDGGESVQCEHRHRRECRRQESQYGASPPQQRNNMHSEMRWYDHTHGDRHTEYSAEGQVGYPHEESLQDYRDGYLRLRTRNEPREEYSEDHERRRDNRQRNERRESIRVNNHTPPSSSVESPESSYNDHGCWKMLERSPPRLTRHDIDRRKNYEDREVASMQRNTSDSDSERTTSSFALTSGENHLRKCKRRDCDNYGYYSHGYCNECYRQ